MTSFVGLNDATETEVLNSASAASVTHSILATKRHNDSVHVMRWRLTSDARVVRIDNSLYVSSVRDGASKYMTLLIKYSAN